MKTEEKAERAIRHALKGIEPNLREELTRAIFHVYNTSGNSVPVGLITTTPLGQRLTKLKCPWCGRLHRQLSCTNAEKKFRKIMASSKLTGL